ncbi:phage GP46 family protein [Methylogaea oryzae]|uniref:Mu-like prophage protein gp46 n=1 Tax=Methylogaea oryzae TaxID=1295382 RepID=A0A8D5AFV0_9GAMM|nr:phage GP46 family protein [Methylogaea oryzae]BBL69688.1 hypothetical protein MoryE10_02940 [Methylogaea oryzae]
MRDFALEQGEYGQWRLAALGVDDTLRSLVIASLFTDRRLIPTDPRPAHVADEILEYSGGCWGDDYPSDGGTPGPQARPRGSLLWTLRRAKQEEETRRLAVLYIDDALRWLIATGRATDVAVDAWWHRPSVLAASIVITQPNGDTWQHDFTMGTT